MSDPKTKENHKRGRPRENKQLWRSVLRLPKETAKRLKRAAKQNATSVNNTIESILEVWLAETKN